LDTTRSARSPCGAFSLVQIAYRHWADRPWIKAVAIDSALASISAQHRQTRGSPNGERRRSPPIGHRPSSSNLTVSFDTVRAMTSAEQDRVADSAPCKLSRTLGTTSHSNEGSDSLAGMTHGDPQLLLVQRLYVDLLRVTSAGCRP
jgi:hypothetical protein